MKNLYYNILPGITDCVAISTRAAYLISDVTPKRKKILSIPKSSFCNAKYWPEMGLIFLSTLEGDVFCVSSKSKEIQWARKFKSGVFGIALWEGNSSLVIESKSIVHLDTNSGLGNDLKIELAGVCGTRGGLIGCNQGDIYYISNPKNSYIKLSSAASYRFPVEFGGGLLAFEEKDQNPGEFSIYDKNNGRRIQIAHLPKCGFIRCIDINADRSGLLISGELSENENYGVWEFKNGSGILKHEEASKKKIVGFSRDGKFMIYNSGEIKYF